MEGWMNSLRYMIRMMIWQLGGKMLIISEMGKLTIWIIWNIRSKRRKLLKRVMLYQIKVNQLQRRVEILLDRCINVVVEEII